MRACERFFGRCRTTLISDEGDHAERQVDVEGPAPAPVVGDGAADQRAADHRERHDAGHHALVLAALPGRDQVADDRHDADHQTAGAEALDGAEADELRPCSGPCR